MNRRGAVSLNRVQPVGPTQAYKTYQVSAPLATHFRRATCAEIDCPHYTNGWRLDSRGLQEADWHAIKQSRRRYTMEDGWLVFEAGQPCFKASTHRVPIGRPEIYRVGRGDWRSYDPRQATIHTRPEDWLDDFRNHQSGIADRLRRG